MKLTELPESLGQLTQLFYQLIVRLHKYSLGRVRYADSVHWQRGLVLDDDYKAGRCWNL